MPAPIPGGLTEADDLRANLAANCLPVSLLEGQVPVYDEFLGVRRKLMSLKIKGWFEEL